MLGESWQKSQWMFPQSWTRHVRQASQLDTGRKIQLDLPSDLRILGDRDAIKQILLIALDNALKHSSAAYQCQRKTARQTD